MATFVSSPLLPQSVVGTSTSMLAGIFDWYSTFAFLAGVTVDDPHTDSLNLWPSLLDPTAPAPRTEMLIGVGGSGFNGAYRNGSIKLIMPNGNSEAADGWSAQYPGSSPVVPPNSVPPDVRCGTTTTPCLFDLARDPEERVNLATTEPALLASMKSRYLELARAASGGGGMNCTLPGEWKIGADGGGTVVLSLLAENVSLTVDSCPNCRFTHAAGQLGASGSLSLVAAGKGVWIREVGQFSAERCTIVWLSHNVTGFGAWPTFFKVQPNASQLARYVQLLLKPLSSPPRVTC